MKKFLGVFLTLIFAIATFAGSVQPPKGFAGKLWSSTLALYASRGPKTQFECTAEPIAKIKGGYRLLTAGHCVQLLPADLKFSVAEEIGGPRTPVTLVKAVLDGTMDFALFDLQTDKVYTLFVLGDESELRVGDTTINPNFAIGAAKQLSLGRVSSMPVPLSPTCYSDECAGDFIVQQDAGPGASGSAVLSVKTHKVIGLLVWQFGRGDIGFGIEPISLYAKFLAGPNQPHPAEKKAEEEDEDN
jgi:hypothetical protein